MGKGGGWKDGCSRWSTAVVVVPGMEIGWLEGIEREGQGLDWIGLDCIALHIGRISEIPLLRRIMIHTYLFFKHKNIM